MRNNQSKPISSSTPGAHSNFLVELIGVNRFYETGHVHALKDVSLKIKRGEFLAVVGPSGSGKTTFLNLISGLDKPSTGKIFFNGDAPSESAQWAKLRLSEIGFVFQSFHLLPAFSALENVQIPMFGLRQTPNERADCARSLLKKLGFSADLSRRPDKLSSGEKQIVAIARSLANDPCMLLADEPTGNLDSINAAKVMHMLAELKETRGLTLIVVTHNPIVAEGADRIVEFLDGRILSVKERNQV